MTEKGELVVNRLSDEVVVDEVDPLRLELVELLSGPQWTELLIEVDRWASWWEQLTHAGGKTYRAPQLRRNLYAAILGQAWSFELTAVAEASGISYDALAWDSAYASQTHGGVGGQVDPGGGVEIDAANPKLASCGHEPELSICPHLHQFADKVEPTGVSSVNTDDTTNHRAPTA